MAEIAPDVTVEVFNANNDTAAQQRQAEQALTRGAKVLVVIPIDGESSAVIADSAAEAGVNFVAVASYSAVGEEGVAYVIENDTSITKEMVCQGPAAETAFCSG